MHQYVLIEPYPITQPTKDETQVVAFSCKAELQDMLKHIDPKDWLALDL